MKATPGPWVVEDTGSPSDTLHIVARANQPAYDWQLLATVTDDFENGVDWTQAQANAALMAAAPKLVAALETMLKPGQYWGRRDNRLDRAWECIYCYRSHPVSIKNVEHREDCPVGIAFAALKLAKGES